MRKEFFRAILLSSFMVAALGTVAVRHYTAPTASELNAQATGLNISMNSQWLEQTEQSALVTSHPDLFGSTMRLMATYEKAMRQSHEELITLVYGNMASHDPVRFQFRRAECWVRNENSTRCTAIDRIART